MKFLSQLKQGRGINLLLAGLVASLTIGGSAMLSKVSASDHDDGETNIKSRNLNLTDLYVFREDWETGNTADAANLVLVMNTNPRSLPRQQYFFNTAATYNFNIGRHATQNDGVTGATDVNFGFSFGAPTSAGTQSISLAVNKYTAGNLTGTQTITNGGTTTAAAPLLGGPPVVPAAFTTNTFSVNTLANTNVPAPTTVTVFAGLREDPFFFDVEAFFKTRASLAGGGGAFFAADASTSQDFAYGYNVNSIVARVPISLLQTTAAEPVFDVWETITIPTTTAALQ